MKLAYVTPARPWSHRRADRRSGGRLAADGVRLAGTVQSNHERPDRRKCDMDLVVLPDGPIVRISEDRGDLARGCTLDRRAGTDRGRGSAAPGRRGGPDRQQVRQARGRRQGLVPVIAEALERGLPVLIGVNGLNLAARFWPLPREGKPTYVTFGSSLRKWQSSHSRRWASTSANGMCRLLPHRWVILKRDQPCNKEKQPCVRRRQEASKTLPSSGRHRQGHVSSGRV
jgi:hypothetical protein